METLMPNTVVEWIPYNNLENIEYLTKGGISEIYTADWINGEYDEWDFGKKQLERGGTCKIILKRLENVESANQSWFEEAKSHLTIKMEEMTKVEENYTSSRLFTSKIHNFGNLPEPRNATEEEQEGYHSKLYDFNIPNNIDDFNKSNKRNSKSSKVITMIRGDSEKLPEEFIKLQINSNDDEKEITQHVDDDDEVYNNPNLHSKEQVELEIPDDGF
ncbi:kinase-like domain-containing protein [Rhizophagus irregularis DAOM 181602=DAOM 197198]|nr:kinase-like domain-containing protein [Rhizophagus irregularis DAOM 181602=DAOM 197198]